MRLDEEYMQFLHIGSFHVPTLTGMEDAFVRANRVCMVLTGESSAQCHQSLSLVRVETLLGGVALPSGRNCALLWIYGCRAAGS